MSRSRKNHSAWMQPSLFDGPALDEASPTPLAVLVQEPETLLAIYRARRLAEEANTRSVAREISQLRSLARGATPAVALTELFSGPERVAQALLEPQRLIAASTGRCRLIAAQRLVRLCAPELGIGSSAEFLAALDRHLPAWTGRGWHSAGSIVAGTRARRRPQGPTIDPADLHRIAEYAPSGDEYRPRRDRAVVHLLCFSGLRPEEVAQLRTNQILADHSYERVYVVVRRSQGEVRLLLATPAVVPLLAVWRDPHDRREGAAGYLLRRSARSERPLTVRTVHGTMRAACAAAGFPQATAADLRAAFGYWLCASRLSDHETANVLGLAQVRSLDRLLKGHRVLAAQRQVREMLGA